MNPEMTSEERKEYIAEGHTEPGWLHIIEKLDDDLSEIDPTYTLLQIKQKFGGLRYYCLYKPSFAEEMYKLVQKAERQCWKTCENCGVTDGVTTNKQGCVRTYCEECRRELL